MNGYTNCTISGNSAYNGGGGVDCSVNSSPTLTNCTISGNSASWGGGVYCYSNSSPSLTDCTISGNFAYSHGGGVDCSVNSSPTLTNCTISGNSGGGVHCSDSSPTLTNCTISGNSPGSWEGGGAYCRENSSPTLTNCTISGNWGAGATCYDSSPTLTNCTISGNWGGGATCWSASPTLTNCTISGNWGGGVWCYNNPYPTLTNCILWGNSGGSLVFGGEGAGPQVSFSCIESDEVWPGEGNINSDPLFCGFRGPAEAYVDPGSPEGGDGRAERPFRDLAAALEFSLSLKANSPCIGAGRGGANMGADLGLCEAGEAIERVVHLAPGGYKMEGLNLSQGASIVGAGADKTVLEGTVFGLRTGAALSGVTVTGGTAGGVVLLDGDSPALMDCTITGNSASFYGGGVFCYNSSPTLTNCTISGNSTGDCGGGVYCQRGSPTLTNCTISGNLGGGVWCSENSYPTLTNCIVWGNSGGSVVSGEGAAPRVSFSCIESDEVWPGEGNINSDPLFCGFRGPAEAYVDPGSPEGGDGRAERPFRDLAAALEFSLSLKANSPCIGSGRGGANMGADLGLCEAGEAIERVVHLAPGGYKMEGLNLSQGASIVGAGADKTVLEGTVFGLRTRAALSGVAVTGGTDSGVSIGRGESPTLTNCTISGNWMDGVSCGPNSSPTLTNCTISGSWMNGVYCGPNSSPTLTNCTISGNSGGGVHCYDSSPTLTNCTISGNWSAGVSCYENSSPTLTNCTISGNRADWEGGGVCCRENSSPTLTNCTISGNWAETGGGVYCSNSSPTLTNCTISGNSATGGGGVYCRENSSPSLRNCIVWGNTPQSVCGKRSYCLTNKDPRFVSKGRFDFTRFVEVEIGGSRVQLPDFIVEAPDYHLQPGSPAIDAGICTGAPSTDKDGVPRPQGAGCDIGAYEYSVECPPDGDTHCLGLTVQGPQGGGPGTYVVTATAKDDSGDSISYTFSAQRGNEAPIVVGPQTTNTASFQLTEGTWTISVAVDDDPWCPDEAADARCSSEYHVQCPPDGDTHCLGLTVQGPQGGGPGTYVVTATAKDDSGDSISYTFSAQRGNEAPIVVGPQAKNTASFELTEGTWTISVAVDDDPWCPDEAADARCSTEVVVQPLGGLQLPGDANQDGTLDLSDAVWLLGHLFLGIHPSLPCEGGTASSPGPGDLAVADANGDGKIDLSDPVSMLNYLFLGGAPPALGTECVRIAGCSDVPGCR